MLCLTSPQVVASGIMCWTRVYVSITIHFDTVFRQVSLQFTITAKFPIGISGLLLVIASILSSILILRTLISWSRLRPVLLWLRWHGTLISWSRRRPVLLCLRWHCVSIPKSHWRRGGNRRVVWGRLPYWSRGTISIVPGRLSLVCLRLLSLHLVGYFSLLLKYLPLLL